MDLFQSYERDFKSVIGSINNAVSSAMYEKPGKLLKKSFVSSCLAMQVSIWLRCMNHYDINLEIQRNVAAKATKEVQSADSLVSSFVAL